jgi:hypothetical protein
MKRNRKNITVFFCFAFLSMVVGLYHPIPLWAQEESSSRVPGLTASLNKESVMVGGIVELTLSYTLPEGAQLVSPLDIRGLEGLTVLETESGDGRIKLKLLVDRLGTWKTGEIFLAFNGREGEKSYLKTDSLSLNVLSNLGDKPEEAHLRPIKDIMPVRPLWIKYWPWLSILLILIMIGAGILYGHRRRKIRSLTAELIDPPDIMARKGIAELEALELFEKGDVKGFYFRFSEIIRQYLESLRGFPAVEYTTEEIASRIQEKQDRILLPLLRHSDLAKFADSRPSIAKKEEEVKMVLSYIEETSAALESNSSKSSTGSDRR